MLFVCACSIENVEANLQTKHNAEMILNEKWSHCLRRQYDKQNKTDYETLKSYEFTNFFA